MLIYGDRDHFQLPFNLNIGYTFAPQGPISPYVFAEPSYHVASGDYYEDSNLGFIGWIGVDFIKRGNIALGLEANFDIAEVEIEDKLRGDTKEIKASEFVSEFDFEV